MSLRPYQSDLIGKVNDAWNQGAQNVLMRLDTGGGKGYMLGQIHGAHRGASCVMAHRQELVSQLSLTLAAAGVPHNIIAADKTRRAIAQEHVAEHGRCYFDPAARCAVASVDTLVRASGLERWQSQVTLWTCDEGHHLVRGNKWDSAIGRFTSPHARGLIPTATPQRADGKGLGRHADGLADVMVEGPPMRWLIGQGFLTDYLIYCPPTDLKVLSDPGASGDWSTVQLRDAARKSHIVGDVVEHYYRYALGKRCIVFTTDVETAEETTAAYLAAGIPAATLTGNSPDRVKILRDFKAGKIWVISAVDIISEGFDLPACEAVIMARPTKSLALYMQQFGRALRLMEGKRWAIVIDCVSNIVEHKGPPDAVRRWTLDRRDKRAKTAANDAIPYRVCLECFQPYERTYRACPHCGYAPEPAGRSRPEQVEGDVALLDPAVLAAMRGEIASVDASEGEAQWAMQQRHVPQIGQLAGLKRHRERKVAQAALRDAMAQWGGVLRAHGYDDSRIQREFWHKWGVDVMTAQTLGADDAEGLRRRILAEGLER